MANARVRGRPIAPLVLSAQERAYLERQVRRQRVARSLSKRCRIILRRPNDPPACPAYPGVDAEGCPEGRSHARPA